MKFVINIMLSLPLAIQANAQTILRFQEHISAHPQYLGDLISISTPHQDLMKLPLDSYPKAGELISKEQIIQWISHKAGSIDYQWRGKKSAQVQQTIKTTGKELLDKAQTALVQHLKSQYDSIKLTAKGTIKDSEFPLSEFQVELPDAYPPAKQICVRLKQGKRSTPVWFAVSAYKSVLVAAHPIKNRTRLQQSDLTLIKHNIAGLHEPPLSTLPESAWLKKSISKGHVLTQADVVNIPQVLRGQTIQVQVKTHGISIVSNAIAQNDGYTDQIIRLKNPASDKYFIAKVTAPGKAEISA